MEVCARVDFDGHQQKVHSEIGSTARVCVPQPTKWQRIGKQIDAAMIFTGPDCVKVQWNMLLLAYKAQGSFAHHLQVRFTLPELG
jgi:hypothetical protein